MFSRSAVDPCYVTAEDLVQLELMLNRFNRLIGELLHGTTVRNSFYPWEIELLIDMESCLVEPRRRPEILRQYQKAVEKQLESGPGPPMKLSQYLQTRVTRRSVIR